MLAVTVQSSYSIRKYGVIITLTLFTAEGNNESTLVTFPYSEHLSNSVNASIPTR